jgi:hypothetical protein
MITCAVDKKHDFEFGEGDSVHGVHQLPKDVPFQPQVYWDKTTPCYGNVVWELEYMVVPFGGVTPVERTYVLSSGSFYEDNVYRTTLDTTIVGKNDDDILYYKLTRGRGTYPHKSILYTFRLAP